MSSIHTAIVRAPSAGFAGGITSSGLGVPDLAAATAQHDRYVEALEAAGVRVIRLDPDPDHPDAPFVEDTAVITKGGAVLTRPGAPSRRGEVDSIRPFLARLAPRVATIQAPGALDGGDVLETGEEFLIGRSERTNDEGARQLSELLEAEGIASRVIDIRGMAGLLHLKTGVSWLGGRRLLAWDVLDTPLRRLGYEVEPVPPEEAYAANCVGVNGRVFLPAGFPRVEISLRREGSALVALDMSEFQKMDGGLSCLSLRFGDAG